MEEYYSFAPQRGMRKYRYRKYDGYKKKWSEIKIIYFRYKRDFYSWLQTLNEFHSSWKTHFEEVKNGA